MSKTQEFKAYGSIRKTKVAGACGVILALGILGMGLQGIVSADEVSTAKPVAVEKKTEVEVPIAHDNLDKAVAEAKDAGVKVEVGAVQDKGVATTETVAEKQKEIEADYAKQEKDVKTVTADYSSKVDKTTKEREVIEKENKAKQEAYDKAVTDHKAEVNRIEAENKAILADNAKKEADTKAENARIERDNAKKLDDYKQAKLNQENANKQIEASNINAKEEYDKDLKKYNQDLAIYNEQKAKLEKLGLSGSSTGVKLYGDYNESGRGSLDFYKNFHAVFEGVKDLEVVDGYLSASPKTEVKYSREGLLEETVDTKEGNTGFFLKNFKKGDYFTLNNIGRTESGKSILAKFTFTSDPVPEFKVKGKDNIQPRMSVIWSKTKPHSSFAISGYNYQITDFDIEYFDEATGKPINLAYVNVLTDLDYDQMYRFEYQDGSTGILKTHSDSQLTKVVENGKEFMKGTTNPMKPYTYDDPSGLEDYSVGTILSSGVMGESSVPKGSLLSIGWGSKNHLTYTASRYSKWVGTNNTRPESHYYAYKAYLEEIAKKEGKPAPTDYDVTHVHTYTFDLWGVNSSIQRPLIPLRKPVEPKLKQKDTKEIPMPTLEKPKEFVPRTTLPIPPAPTPPEKKKIPEMPLVPTVKVNYSRLRVTPSTPKPVKAITDNYTNNIDGANTFDKNVKFSLTTDYKPYSTFTTDSKTYGKTWAVVDDVQDGAYKVDDSKITMKDSTGKDVKALFNMYHVLSEKERTKEIQNILKEAGLNPKGEFYLWVAKNSASFYKNYVKQDKNITIELPARLLVEKGQIVKNDFYQIDFGIGHQSNLVTVEVPDVKSEKHVLDRTGKKVLDGKEVQLGDFVQYLLDGVTVPEKHDTLYQYDGLDKLDMKHDRYTGNWKGIIKGTEYTAEKQLVLPYDVTLKNGKVIKAGDKIEKGSSYAFTFEFNQATNSEFIKKLVTVKWDAKGGQWSYVINQDFLNSLGVKGTFDADFYIEAERIETGDKIENTFINIVNKQEMTAKVITRTPEPPKPKHPEKHVLDRSGKKVLDGKEVQLGDFVQYLLDGATVPERHHTLYQYDGLDKLDMKHDRYTGNWKGIIKGTEYTAEKQLVLPYDVTLKNGKVIKAGDKIEKGSSYAFTFEFNQATNSEFIKKLVTVKWDAKGGQWSYVINQDFLNSLGIKGTFDADFYIEVERIETGDKIENTFINIVNKQEMTAKVITRTPEPPKPKHPEKHALDKTGQKVLDGKEVQMGELIQYLLDGATVPERHHMLYQYDGLDKLDMKHDRYTGNWKGIIKGTEYTAEKQLVLPYDVTLKNGKVIKAGDKIEKGSSYAFTFEFNQATNSEFIKKLVTVKWDAKGGQWSYVINQDFLNSLGIKGTFDADFYIEVERIAAGEVENTFVNIVNGQEMTAKVTTRTPEPPKPEEPGKPKQSLPNTGTASSMLPVVGMILGLLSLAGLRKSKEN